jgi:uncharacterized protein YbjT (DUF2867 family)
MVRALVTGASGYVGSRLVRELHSLGEPVGCVARDPSRVTFDPAVTVHRGDMLDVNSLSSIGDGYTTAYYLVHSMGRGGAADYEQRDASAASNFAHFATTAGIDRVVYLGGLGDRPGSHHLRSRLRVGEILRDQGPPLTWFRAGMVVGAGSESYRTLRSLVERLPVMLALSWLDTPTQAIAIGDVLRYLIEAPHIAQTRSREIQIGSAEILTLWPDARPDGRLPGFASSPPYSRATAHTMAFVALDRPHHTGRRRGREAVDRGTLDRHDRHRPIRNGAVRLPAALVRAGVARGHRRGRRIPSPGYVVTPTSSVVSPSNSGLSQPRLEGLTQALGAG